MKNNKINVAFFGTPWIAKECLSTLFNLENVNICCVVSQPDKTNDRNKKINYSEVKNFCIENNLKLIQPIKIADAYDELVLINPDIIITCAYGQFIPEKILNIPKYKCVNVHASLLPKLRGGAPIHWAIINGEQETGITLMYSIKKMDAGNIIFQESIKIQDNDTYKSLLIKLSELAQKMLQKHFNDLIDENLKGIEQEENKVTFAYNITKEQEIINFNESCKNINAKIRGLNDKPVAKIIIDNQPIKIYESAITNIKSSQTPGTILNITKSGIEIATNDYNILITKVQLPNKKPSEIKDLINGNLKYFKIGEII